MPYLPGTPSVTAALASTILPVTVLPLVLGGGLPVSMRTLLRALGRSSVRGNSEATGAAVPVAWGAAIEVPLKQA